MVEQALSTDVIAANIARVREQIERACVAGKRSPDEVTLVAVSKTKPVEAIAAAANNGIVHFGENRVQEAKEKVSLLPPHLQWHLIGSLQTNKVKLALSLFSYIHSVDRITLVEALAKQENSSNIPVFMQVNVAEEASKHGVSVAEAVTLARAISASGLTLSGLMTVAPFTENPEDVRPVFRRLKQLFVQLQDLALPGANLRHLSMGMSGDYQVAIEEGATIVRVGSAIFGARPLGTASQGGI